MDKVLQLSVHEFVDFLLRTGDIDNRIYNTDVGGVTSTKYVNKRDDLEEKLWSSKLYRKFYRICKRTGIIRLVKKLAKRI